MDLLLLPFLLYYKSISVYASLAQLDRAFVYGTKGQGFESLRTHQIEQC